MQFDSFDNIKWDLIKNKIQKAKKVKKQGKHDPYYLDISVSFDTETTSTYENGEKFAFMYVWQFGIDGYYCYGRSWQEWLKMMMFLQKAGDLNKDKRLIIFIHNLSFEFQFFRKYIPWVDVFAKREREPMKALSSYGIEFRDSLVLSGYKLDNVAKNLTSHKIEKMDGDLDYRLDRNSKTTFSGKELGYMKHDVKILVYYIDEQRKQYGDIAHIPLTNTGRVRLVVRKNCFGNTSGSRLNYLGCMKLLELTAADYKELKQAFAGGFTHANPNHVGKTYHNVASIDFTSSYPTVMIAEQFPNSRFFDYKFKNWDDFNDLMKKRLVIFQVDFKNLVSTVDFDNYISRSRCLDADGVTENNGRVFSADKASIVVTNIDFEIIRKVYTWDDIKISRVKWCYKHYLPKPIIKSIIEFYKNKTTLKNVVGKNAEYMHAKGMLNSIYGMSVSDIIHDETDYQNNKWTTDPADAEKQIYKYNESKNRFLYYAWGVFVTAYARRNLWSGILSIKQDYIYSDTDSIKMLNYEKHKSYVESYNKMIQKKLAKTLTFYKLRLDSVSPKTVKGIKKPLGVWDFEGFYNSFKTLGAKRYVYTQDGHLETTIAGLGKKQGAKYLLSISDNDPEKAVHNFRNSFKVPAGKTGKLTHTYIDDMKSFLVRDYQGHVSRETALSSVHLEPAPFELTISETFKRFLQGLGQGVIIIENNRPAEGI